MALKPRGVVLHLSASKYGDRAEIDAWHRQRGFSEIGYHRVILNGRAKHNSVYDAARDGEVQKGRADASEGAHCKAGGMNRCTFGICSVGDPGTVPAGAQAADPSLTKAKYLTHKQAAALVDLVARLCIQNGWDPKGTFTHPVTGRATPVISQHSDWEAAKPFCANLNIANIRSKVAERIAVIRSTPVPRGAPSDADANARFAPVPEFTPAPEHEEDIEEPDTDVPPETGDGEQWIGGD